MISCPWCWKKPLLTAQRDEELCRFIEALIGVFLVYLGKSSYSLSGALLINFCFDEETLFKMWKWMHFPAYLASQGHETWGYPPCAHDLKVSQRLLLHTSRVSVGDCRKYNTVSSGWRAKEQTSLVLCTPSTFRWGKVADYCLHLPACHFGLQRTEAAPILCHPFCLFWVMKERYIFFSPHQTDKMCWQLGLHENRSGSTSVPCSPGWQVGRE